MSNLVNHATRELSRAGLFDKDSDYEGQLGEAVLELMRTFSLQGHSGASANATIHLFNTLAQFKPLSPPQKGDYWVPVGYQVWQNERDSEVFSLDAGMTYYRLSEQRRWVMRLLPRRLLMALPIWIKYPMHRSAS